MSESSKYPINGICLFKNFTQQVENNNYTAKSIGRMCGINGWHVSLDTGIKDGITYVYPFLGSGGFGNIAIHCFFMFLNRDISKNSPSKFRTYSKNGDRSYGRKIALETLLDERNGWLNNGTISIEYGFRVEAIQIYWNGIWEFNFHDMVTLEEQDSITLHVYDLAKRFTLYSPKQLVKFHSSYLKNQSLAYCHSGVAQVSELLQIAHGVNTYVKNFRDLLHIAHELGFRNVIKCCERRLIEEEKCQDVLSGYYLAAYFNLNRYMVHLLKHIGGARSLAALLLTLDIRVLSSENMKQCTKYFFENA